jgi:hypothetical protein
MVAADHQWEVAPCSQFGDASGQRQRNLAHGLDRIGRNRRRQAQRLVPRKAGTRARQVVEEMQRSAALPSRPGSPECPARSRWPRR